ncbi:hypothetical protein [Natrononativus amylolyticus]|uniref:hypothetical protein n=1 Tax=Natrononativus amylolyticus TaxID=2963434 RepID=UPI0020CCB0F9|nr:hypothetical protein [Natrononativus amylolyticus]
MAFDDLLPGFLGLTSEPESAGDGVLHECRHCGSKFDAAPDRCRVCDSSEIATYEFAAGTTREE